MLKVEYLFCLMFALLGTVLGNLFLTPETLLAYPPPAVSGEYIAVNSRDGQRRIELSTYDGSHTHSEKGLPVIAVYDRSQKLRLLFRLAGKNESPALILKDSNGQDRMVLGLALNAESEMPYINFYDKAGKKKNVGWNLLTD